MLLKDNHDCSTYSIRGLDNQLIAEMNKVKLGLLVRIDDLDVSLGKGVHPWLQATAKKRLASAIALRGKRLIINSAFRTLAGQWLLREHFLNGRCGIPAAAPPGQSNHNNASALDVEDSQGWRSALRSNNWAWLGDFDPVHYDCIDRAIIPIHFIAVKAFQRLWNIAHPTDRLTEDGDFGDATASRLRNSPIEGFPNINPPRILRLTDPIQMGNDVGNVQLLLRKAGITLQTADRVYGSGTAQAVKAFQKSRNLEADGVVGASTLKALALV
jgi:hypothetical protein